MKKLALLQISVMIFMLIFLAFFIYTNYKSLEEEKKNLSSFKIIRPPSEISTLAVFDKFILAGGKDGIYKIDINSKKLLEKIEDDNSLKYLKSIYIDQQKNIWIGHDKGVRIINGNIEINLSINEGLLDNRVNTIKGDSKGDVWVGTWGGVSIFRNFKILKKITKEDGLRANMVNVILHDSYGGTWFGAYNVNDAGISYKSNNGKWSYFDTSNSLLHNYITSILQTEDKKVWVGTGLLDLGGATVFKYSKSDVLHKKQKNKVINSSEYEWIIERKVLKSNGIAGEKVRSIFQDKSGQMWLGSEYDGLAVSRKFDWKVFTTKNGLSDDEIKCIVQDRNGVIWLGTRDGISYFN
jgi:ligand-binding sensor domain-containing protein